MLNTHHIFKNLSTTIKSVILNNQGAIRFASISSNTVEEKKIRVKDVKINYIRTGHGDHPVLLLPGAMGTIWTNFKPQIEALNKEKFTIVAWDPPGCGKSRPPDKEFLRNFYHKDADYATELMTNLGYSKFSLIGWSGGGITSLIMAGNNPESIRKIVVVSTCPEILPHEVQIFKGVRNIDALSEHLKAPLIAVYGEEYFRSRWSAWADAMVNIYEESNGDICRDAVKQIQCPTLIIHGKKDAMVDLRHAKYLLNHIAKSRLEIFENGTHSLHLRYHEEFNQLVNQFLLENS